MEMRGMDELEGYRRQIDEIDARLIELFEKRMNIVRKVGRYKKEQRLPVLQSGREETVLQKAVEHLRDKEYAPAAIRFMNATMELSRAAQRRDIGVYGAMPEGGQPLSGTVGFQGVAGSFSEQALIELFGEERARREYAAFEDVFLALQRQEIDYGVLPIENSSAGAVSEVYDLLGKYGFYIVGEHCCAISQNLVGLSGASLETVATVYSHPQGLEQSRAYLAEHPTWELHPYPNTAAAAKLVSEMGDPAKAAISSKRAAALYGLQVLAPDINSRTDNTTRFIVIGRALEPQDANKISVVFTLMNKSGTLYQTLRTFADNEINMVQIESRPMPDAMWDYRFYIDFEGDIHSPQVQQVLAQIDRDSSRYRLLGAYRSAQR